MPGRVFRQSEFERDESAHQIERIVDRSQAAGICRADRAEECGRLSHFLLPGL